MTASEAVKLAEKVLNVVDGYAYCAQRWEPRKEGDYDDFRDTIIDTIAEHGGD